MQMRGRKVLASCRVVRGWLYSNMWVCRTTGQLNTVLMWCFLSAGSTIKETFKAACKEDGSQKDTYKDAIKAEAKRYSHWVREVQQDSDAGSEFCDSETSGF